MERVCSANGTSANKVAADNCRESADTNVNGNTLPACGNILPDHNWFALMARKLWQFKVAAQLHYLLGKSERTGRAWAAGDSEPPGGVMVALLRTDEGGAILEWIMADFEHVAWWQVRQRDRAIAEMYHRQRAEAKRLGLE